MRAPDALGDYGEETPRNRPPQSLDEMLGLRVPHPEGEEYVDRPGSGGRPGLSRLGPSLDNGCLSAGGYQCGYSSGSGSARPKQVSASTIRGNSRGGGSRSQETQGQERPMAVLGHARERTQRYSSLLDSVPSASRSGASSDHLDDLDLGSLSLWERYLYSSFLDIPTIATTATTTTTTTTGTAPGIGVGIGTALDAANTSPPLDELFYLHGTGDAPPDERLPTYEEVMATLPSPPPLPPRDTAASSSSRSRSRSRSVPSYVHNYDFTPPAHTAPSYHLLSIDQSRISHPSPFPYGRTASPINPSPANNNPTSVASVLGLTNHHHHRNHNTMRPISSPPPAANPCPEGIPLELVTDRFGNRRRELVWRGPDPSRMGLLGLGMARGLGQRERSRRERPRRGG